MSERLRELLTAATPGPWTKITFGNASTAKAAGVMASFAYATARHAGVPMTDLTVIDGPAGQYAIGFTGNGSHSPENAALIVAAINALPDLLILADNAREAHAEHYGSMPKGACETCDALNRLDGAS